MASKSTIRDVHFCGSMKLPGRVGEMTNEIEATREVMQEIAAALPSRIRRLPDGEVGKRGNFTQWQLPVFHETPAICVEIFKPQTGGLWPAISPGDSIKLGTPGYSAYAIQSFAVFTSLKQQGKIDAATKFLVCLPTPLNPVTFIVRQEFRNQVEPMYEQLLVDELKTIQENIPHDQLAIQWDCPVELAMLEGTAGPWNMMVPHFQPTIEVLVDRIKRLIAAVKPDVEVGIHLCYGDVQHKHFIEPKDTTLLVDLSNAIFAAADRGINWIHLPVPIERSDEAYFAPLGRLAIGSSTELYLGLVHANDLQGTRSRIAAAQKFVPTFGIRTECGLGRTSSADVASILEIERELTSPTQ